MFINKLQKVYYVARRYRSKKQVVKSAAQIRRCMAAESLTRRASQQGSKYADGNNRNIFDVHCMVLASLFGRHIYAVYVYKYYRSKAQNPEGEYLLSLQTNIATKGCKVMERASMVLQRRHLGRVVTRPGKQRCSLIDGGNKGSLLDM